MTLWLGGMAALGADLIWRTFFPESPHPQFVVLWLLRESVRHDDYLVPTFAFVAGAAWDVALCGVFLHHSLLWLFFVLMVRRLTSIVWFEYLVTQILLAVVVSSVLRGAETMMWLSRWPTHVAETRIIQCLLGGVVLDGFFFPIVWRLNRTSTRRSVLGTARL
ncbi:MAG: rod shape-determining protein MreD [bacterium]